MMPVIHPASLFESAHSSTKLGSSAGQVFAPIWASTCAVHIRKTRRAGDMTAKFQRPKRTAYLTQARSGAASANHRQNLRRGLGCQSLQFISSAVLDWVRRPYNRRRKAKRAACAAAACLNSTVAVARLEAAVSRVWMSCKLHDVHDPQSASASITKSACSTISWSKASGAGLVCVGFLKRMVSTPAALDHAAPAHP